MVQYNRRQFMKQSSIAAGLTVVGPGAIRSYAANDKLNVAMVGASGKATVHVSNAVNENIVALCDVDAGLIASARKRFNITGGKDFSDYREMFDKVKDIDAVFVTTPDHNHFPASMLAIAAGAGVYTEKPMTHSVWEARRLTEYAAEKGVATQMGNQGTSGEYWRLLCEYIWADKLGEIREVDTFTNRPIWPQGMDRPKGEDKIPDDLNWDAWIGPAPMRPFIGGPGGGSKKSRGPYHQFNWRGWQDFGTGALGDMACHIMAGANWALKLGEADYVEIEAESGPVNNESFPAWATIKYKFPARGDLPPVTVTWYDGKKGEHPNLPARPEELEAGRSFSARQANVFHGSKATMMCGNHGAGLRVIPESKHREIEKPQPVLERVPGGPNGHQKDFFRYCRDGKPGSSAFSVAGKLTELVLLGNLVVLSGDSVKYDFKTGQVTNSSKANELIRGDYRKGWDFSDLS